MHFLIPIGVLLWCLMVEELSPGLSAFYAIVAQVLLMITQRPLIEFFRRKKDVGTELRRGFTEVIDGCNDGARNMIGIAVATGCAGLIVGAITLTGLGLRDDGFRRVRLRRQRDGDAAVHRIRVPGAWHGRADDGELHPGRDADGAGDRRARCAIGLVIPLIAVHLFVFYYGIMGDITPPVGLASFAAAAIAKEDPIQVGIQGSVYALRTVLLPFIWIFNPGAVADRCAWLVGGSAGRDISDHCVAVVRRRHARMVSHQVSLVGGRAAADRDIHIVPPGLVRRPHRGGVHRCACVALL